MCGGVGRCKGCASAVISSFLMWRILLIHLWLSWEYAGAKDNVHGEGGPMHVESPRYQNKLHDIFFEGAAQAGISQNLNFNDWGHGPVSSTTGFLEAFRKQLRSSSVQTASECEELDKWLRSSIAHWATHSSRFLGLREETHLRRLSPVREASCKQHCPICSLCPNMQRLVCKRQGARQIMMLGPRSRSLYGAVPFWSTDLVTLGVVTTSIQAFHLDLCCRKAMGNSKCARRGACVQMHTGST